MNKHIAILLSFIVLVLSSCKTKYAVVEKEIPIEKVRVEYRTSTLIDSIYIHDSINVYTKGDTIYKDKTKLIYKNQIVTDTIHKTDSIDKPIYITKTEIQEVNTPTKLQSILISSGVILWAVVTLSILVCIIKSKLK